MSKTPEPYKFIIVVIALKPWIHRVSGFDFNLLPSV